MRRGRSSRTAQFVANLRALGDLAPTVAGFSDPVVEKFLDPRLRSGVARMRARVAAGRARAPFPFWLRGMGIFNQFRTVVLDRAVLSAVPFDQLVILGAGFDSRAWRLPHLVSATVYEVDHPDTQMVKRQRAAGLAPRAKEIRFVAADLTHDDLGARLKDAGFRPELKSFWIWEGVVMYLAPEHVEQNLRTMASLSSAGGGLAFTYLSKKNGRVPKSILLAFMGEPVRSAFKPSELDALTRRTGWQTVSNPASRIGCAPAHRGSPSPNVRSACSGGSASGLAPVWICCSEPRRHPHSRPAQEPPAAPQRRLWRWGRFLLWLVLFLVATVAYDIAHDLWDIPAVPAMNWWLALPAREAQCRAVLPGATPLARPTAAP